jgi:hypothetical protein
MRTRRAAFNSAPFLAWTPGAAGTITQAQHEQETRIAHDEDHNQLPNVDVLDGSI